MITLVLVERDGKGEVTGQTFGKEFYTAQAAAQWYDRQRGHSIEREIEQNEKGVPPIRWKAA